MNVHFVELPGWRFDAREEPPGVYRLTGWWRGEPRIVHTGADTTELLERCRRDAISATEAATPDSAPEK